MESKCSQWMIAAIPIGEKVSYQVYRIIDTSQTEHNGNRVTKGLYESRRDAEALARHLNTEEAVK